MQGYRQRLISMQDQYIFHDWNFILTNANTNVLVLTKPNPIRKSSKFDIQKVEVEILWPTQIFRLIYSDKPICISKYAYIGEIGLNNTKNIFIFKNESLMYFFHILYWNTCVIWKNESVQILWLIFATTNSFYF